MKPEEIKTRLRDEMADLAPDRLEDLLAACDAQPQEHAPQPVPMLAPRRPVWKPLAAAAVFVLLLGGIFGYRALDKNVCTVIVDINPSVTLTAVSYTHLDVYKRQPFRSAQRATAARASTGGCFAPDKIATPALEPTAPGRALLLPRFLLHTRK